METKRKGKAPTPAPYSARQDAIEFLQPVVDGTQQFGSRIRLTELVSDYLGKPVSRHLILRWLRDDAAKRQIPHLGIGLVVRKVFEANKEKFLKPWDAAKRRQPRGGKNTKRNARKKHAQKTT